MRGIESAFEGIPDYTARFTRRKHTQSGVTVIATYPGSGTILEKSSSMEIITPPKRDGQAKGKKNSRKA